MKERNRIDILPYHSPCGTLLLGSMGDALCLCDWGEEMPRASIQQRFGRLSAAEFRRQESPVTLQAAKELDEYFEGRRTVFTVPMRLVGTVFQQKVWNALLEVPYGETVSYLALAQKMGDRQAVRAVANANRLNALSLFVPCHRVIGSDSRLVGYAGGLPAKRFLLEMEQRVSGKGSLLF